MSARYSRDPYNMLDQLKKMNLKHVKVNISIKNPSKYLHSSSQVAYGVKKNATASKKS